MKTNRISILFPLALATLFLSGCNTRGVLVIPADTHSHTTVVTRYAPPPHAPAHGHRHRHHDHDLRFDTDFGAYLVISMPGIYFYGDHYIRFYNNSWQITTRLKDKWRPARQNDIPRKLKTRHAKKHQHRDERRNKHRNEHRRDEHRNDAPKHGHRRHHHNHDLSFDSKIGAYIILKQPGIFFHNDRYIRHHRGAWQTTNKLNGRWRTARDEEVPRKLKSTKHAKKERKQKRENSKERYKEKWQ